MPTRRPRSSSYRGLRSRIIPRRCRRWEREDFIFMDHPELIPPDDKPSRRPSPGQQRPKRGVVAPGNDRCPEEGGKPVQGGEPYLRKGEEPVDAGEEVREDEILVPEDHRAVQDDAGGIVGNDDVGDPAAVDGTEGLQEAEGTGLSPPRRGKDLPGTHGHISYPQSLRLGPPGKKPGEEP